MSRSTLDAEKIQAGPAESGNGGRPRIFELQGGYTRMLRAAFTKVVFGIFILWLIYTLIMLAIGISIVMDPSQAVESHVTESGTVTFTQDDDAPIMFMFVCFPVNILLTTLWFYFWRFRRKRDMAIEILPSYLSMYRIAKLEDMAGRMGITMKEMDKIMKICMKEGTARGSFNHSGEFVFEGTRVHAIPLGFVCTNCGANVEKTFLEGEIVKCTCCGAPLDASAR